MSAFNKFLDIHAPEMKGDIKQNAVALNGYAASLKIQGVRPYDSLNALVDALTVKANGKNISIDVVHAIADALEDLRGQCTSTNGRTGHNAGRTACKASVQFISGVLATAAHQAKAATSYEEAEERILTVMRAVTGLSHAEFKYMRSSDTGKDIAKSGIPTSKLASAPKVAPAAMRPALAGAGG